MRPLIALALFAILASTFAAFRVQSHGVPVPGTACHQNPPGEAPGYHCVHPEPDRMLRLRCARLERYMKHPGKRRAATADFKRLGCLRVEPRS